MGHVLQKLIWVAAASTAGAHAGEAAVARARLSSVKISMMEMPRE